jgi:hypothetical protein
MKKVIKVVVLLVVAMFMATPVFAQKAAGDKPADNMQILQEKIKADKKLIVASNMELTEAEAKGFWPVYEAYQKDLGAINKRIAAMIKAYAEAYSAKTVDNAKAKKLTSDFLSIQSAEVNLIKSYVPKLSKVLPDTKVARYIQIENKIRAAVKYELAEQIPLAQ